MDLNKYNNRVRYSIIAPNIIQPFSVYQVSVTIHDPHHKLSNPVSICASVRVEKNGQDITVSEKTVSFSSNKTELVAVNLDELDIEHQHKLVIVGLNGIKFHHGANLSIQSRSYIILIPTDKTIYRPGDLVQFRVILLDSLLKPVSDDITDNGLNIYINDPNYNCVKQWCNVKRVNGVFSGKFQLPSFYSHDSCYWKIRAEIEEESVEEYIEMQKYVVPKFEVFIDAPDFIVRTDDKLIAIVTAKYFHKKPMSARAEVKMNRSWKDVIIKKIDIKNGSGVVEFDIQNEILRGIVDIDLFEIEVIVTEEYSDHSISCNKSIKVLENLYVINTKYDETFFMPEKLFDVTIHVRKYDNSSISIDDTNKKIKLIQTNGTVTKDVEKYTENLIESSRDCELDQNGDLRVSFCCKKNDLWMNLSVNYMGNEYSLKRFYLESDARQKYKIEALEAEVVTPSRVINQDITVKVTCTKVFEQFTYVLISRNKIVEANTILLPGNRTNFHTFTFFADNNMTPEVIILIYIVTDNDIWSKRLEMSLEDQFMNHVDLSLSKVKSHPMDEIEISVSANPKSYVGLLSYDKSISEDDIDLNADAIFQIKHNKISETNSSHKTHLDHLNYWQVFKSINIIFFTNVMPPKRSVEKSRKTTASNEINNELVEFETSSPEQNPQLLPVHPKPFYDQKKSPKIWIWDEKTDENFSGLWTLKTKAPDTMASWMITAFAIDPVNGFGICKIPATLSVFQPFFVSFNLPYSIKRGEVLNVPCVVFNYTNKELQGEIILENEHNEFEFVDAANNGQIYSKLAEQKMCTKKFYVAGSGTTSIDFTIKVTRIGQISIKVVVEAPNFNDGILKKLNVEAEGITQHFSRSVLIDLSEKSEFEPTSIKIDIPETVVPDSTRIEVTCLGDILGRYATSSQNLTRKPFGCEEQNTLQFALNVIVLDYLQNTNHLTPEIKDTTIHALEAQYQSIIHYKYSNENDSFSLFGKEDDPGSIWLTAFVLKYLKQAEKYILIDNNIMKNGAQFLAEAQEDDGSFNKEDDIYINHYQVGVALTAHILIAFLEFKEIDDEYQNIIDKSLQNIVESIGNINDTYTFAIVAYALQLADHPAKTEVLQNLLNRAQVTGDQKWWGGQSDSDLQSSSSTIEQTSYALLAVLRAKGTENPLPIVKFLLNQRNEKGGFNGIQDTILSIEALARFAEIIASSETILDLTIKSNVDNKEKRFAVSGENALILQNEKLSPVTRTVILNATGRGFALFETSYQYNISEVNQKSKFQIEIEAKQLNLDILELNISLSQDKENSNLSILEVYLPSGFVIDTEVLKELVKPDSPSLIKLAETRNDDTVAIIYLKDLNMKTYKLKLVALCLHDVAERRTAWVAVYDYHNSGLLAQQIYSVA